MQTPILDSEGAVKGIEFDFSLPDEPAASEPALKPEEPADSKQSILPADPLDKVVDFGKREFEVPLSMREPEIEDTNQKETGQEKTEAEVKQNELEIAARKIGWTPKEEFKGNPDNWESAEDYIFRTKSLLNEVSEQKKQAAEELKTLKKQISQITAEQQAQKIAKLKEEHRLLSEEGDYDAAEKVLDEIVKLKAGVIETEPQAKEQFNPEQNAPDPMVVNWEHTNKSWYGVDPRLTQSAIEYSDFLASKNIPIPKALKMLDEFMEPMLSKRNGSANKTANTPPTLPNGNTNSKKSGTFGWDNLTPFEQKVANDFIEDGTYKTREEYLRDYIRSNGVK